MEDYKLNQLVWAKVKGFPWWPGTIVEISKERKDLYTINFIGDNTQ